MSLQPQAQDQDNSQDCCLHNTQLTDVGKSLSGNTTLLSAMLTDFGKSVSENVEFLATLKDLVPTLQKMISAQKNQVLLRQQLDHFKNIGDKVQDTLIEIRQSLPSRLTGPHSIFLTLVDSRTLSILHFSTIGRFWKLQSVLSLGSVVSKWSRRNSTCSKIHVARAR